MTRRSFFATVALLVALVSRVGANPPSLIQTSPQFWAVGVSPATQTRVSLTFNQPMRAGFADWFGRGVLSPNASSNEMGQDQSSFSIRVRLEPGKVYILALNELGTPGVGFQNERGESMAPRFLVFQTSGVPATEDAPPRVLNTLPGNASQDVNPAKTKGIAITFDRPMETKKHGFHLLEEKKPVDLKTVPFAYSADGKTFTLNYPLKPSTHYEVVMNNSEDIGFAATNRVPLWPVRFSFATGQPR